jgi:hypothetical protein
VNKTTTRVCAYWFFPNAEFEQQGDKKVCFCLVDDFSREFDMDLFTRHQSGGNQ